MAKITFVRLVNEGIATGELNGVATETKWFTVELAKMNGVMKTSTKVNFWEKDIDEKALKALKPGSLFGDGDIVTEFIPQGYEVNGKVVNTLTLFIPQGQSVLAVLAKRGIEISVPDEVVEA
jgi:hypothetical protein